MLRELVAKIVTCAEIAGDAIKRISTYDDLDVVNKVGFEMKIINTKKGKNEFDPQTEADRVAQSILLYYLKIFYPDCLIIAEEVSQ